MKYKEKIINFYAGSTWIFSSTFGDGITIMFNKGKKIKTSADVYNFT